MNREKTVLKLIAWLVSLSKIKLHQMHNIIANFQGRYLPTAFFAHVKAVLKVMLTETQVYIKHQKMEKICEIIIYLVQKNLYKKC